MINTRNIRLAVCLAILQTLLAPSPVSACSCEAGVTLPQYFARYDAVFSGKVVRIVDNYQPIFSTLDNVFRKFGFPSYFFYEDGIYWGYSVFLYVFDSWKGVKGTVAEVDTGYGMGDCGYTFELDKEYLIYASHAYGIPDNYWVTGTCGRTAELSNATEDIKYLDTFPTIPLQYTLPIMWTEKDLIFFGLPSLIIVGALVFIKLRRKDNRQDI